MDMDKKEAQLQERLDRIARMEAEILRREKELKAKEVAKKQIPLRLSATLWQEINALAEADFRSVNGEIEFLLTEAVRKRKGQ